MCGSKKCTFDEYIKKTQEEDFEAKLRNYLNLTISDKSSLHGAWKDPHPTQFDFYDFTTKQVINLNLHSKKNKYSNEKKEDSGDSIEYQSAKKTAMNAW